MLAKPFHYVAGILAGTGLAYLSGYFDIRMQAPIWEWLTNAMLVFIAICITYAFIEESK